MACTFKNRIIEIFFLENFKKIYKEGHLNTLQWSHMYINHDRSESDQTSLIICINHVHLQGGLKKSLLTTDRFSFDTRSRLVQKITKVLMLFFFGIKHGFGHTRFSATRHSEVEHSLSWKGFHGVWKIPITDGLCQYFWRKFFLKKSFDEIIYRLKTNFELIIKNNSIEVSVENVSQF